MYILKLYVLIAAIFFVFPTTVAAELVTYDLKGSEASGGNFDFDFQFGFFTDMSGGVANDLTIALEASVAGSGETDLFAINADDDGLGVDADGIGEDDTAQLDGVNGNESIEFLFVLPTTISSIKLHAIEIVDFAGNDTGTLTVDGSASTAIANGTSTPVPTHDNLAETPFTVAYTAGNAGDGFGLVSITLDVTAVPEPGTTALLGVLAVAGLCTRRRPPGLV